ncbi:sodium ABC transporter ATP-binding protein, partial [Staphylococcus aureus]|nr:sodium ABC transporter ATP-binding protein [Staphylococcus aureus]
KDLNDWGSTIVYSSLRMEHVEELCDDVCILDKGQLVVSCDINHVRASNGNKKFVIESETTLPDLTNIRGIIDSENMKQGLQLTIENEEV